MQIERRPLPFQRARLLRLFAALLLSALSADSAAGAEIRRGGSPAAREPDGGAGGDRDTDAPPPPTIPCPNCQATGRQVCPRCEGRKHLFKACHHCDGRGRRPCLQCNKPPTEEGLATSTPGFVPCSTCGGSGSVGSRPPRVCPKCGGEQRLPCLSCRGKGTLKCRAEVIDRICPTCRLAGRITCRTCDGTRRVSAEAVTKKARRPARSARKTRTTRKKAERTVEERFGELIRLREQCLALFSIDAQPELESIHRTVGELLSELNLVFGSETTDMRNRLRRIRRAVAELRSRWGDLRLHYEPFDRAFQQCEKIWQKVDDAPSEEKSRWLANWEEDMGIAIRIAEQKARRIENTDPASVHEDFLTLVASWAKIEPQARSLILAASADGGDEADGGRIGRVPVSARSRGGRSPIRAVAGTEESGERSGPSSGYQVPRADQGTRDDPEPDAEAVPSPDPDDFDDPWDSPPSPPQGGGSFLMGFLWGMACFLLGAIGFHFFRRRS